MTKKIALERHFLTPGLDRGVRVLDTAHARGRAAFAATWLTLMWDLVTSALGMTSHGLFDRGARTWIYTDGVSGDLPLRSATLQDRSPLLTPFTIRHRAVHELGVFFR